MPITGQPKKVRGGLIRSSLIYGLGDLANRSLTVLLLIPLFTNVLPLEEYGIITTLTPMVWLLNAMLIMTMDGTLVRFYFDDDTPEYRRRLLGTVTVYVILVPIIIVGLLLAFSRPLFEFVLNDIPFYPYGVLLYCTSYFLVLPRIVLALWRAEEKAVHYIALSSGCFFINVLAIIMAVAALRSGVLGKMVAELLVATVFWSFAAFIIIRRISWRIDFALLTTLMLFALPLLPHTIGRWLLNYVSRILLVTNAGLEEAGLFGIASQLGTILLLIAGAIQQAMTPWFYMTAKQPNSKTKLAQTATYLFVLCAIITLAVSILGREALIILSSEEYQSAHYLIPILSLGSFFVAAYAFPIMSLMFLKLTKIIPVITFISASITIIGNILFVPRYGMVGAAWSTVAGQFALFLLTFIVAQRAFLLPYEYRKILLTTMVVGVAYAVSLFITNDQLWISLICKAMVLLAVPVGLWMVGVIERQDVTRMLISLGVKSQN